MSASERDGTGENSTENWTLHEFFSPIFSLSPRRIRRCAVMRVQTRTRVFPSLIWLRVYIQIGRVLGPFHVGEFAISGHRILHESTEIQGSAEGNGNEMADRCRRSAISFHGITGSGSKRRNILSQLVPDQAILDNRKGTVRSGSIEGWIVSGQTPRAWKVISLR